MKRIHETPVQVEKVIEKVTEIKREVVESEGGPIDLLGKTVFVGCTSYAYSGTLSGVNDRFIEISNPEMVYDTGAWSNKKWATSEKLPTPKTLINIAQIEQIFEIVR